MTKIGDLLSSHQHILDAAPKIIIGFSGGMDSSILLNSVAQTFSHKRLLAIHVNHQIHPESDQWETHCENVARDLGIPLVCEKVSLCGESGIEQKARDARYQVFEKHLMSGDLLLTAHHADDQLETFLFRLFRGSGIKGLKGIPVSRPVGKGQLLRPLLTYSRQELKVMALNAEIEWIEDTSNSDIRFDRNYIRNQIVPQITGRWAKANRQIISVVEQLKDIDSLLSEVADQDLKECAWRVEAVGVSIEISLLRQLTSSRQNNLLRRFIYSYQGVQPNRQVLETMRSDVLEAAEDSQPILRCADIEIRRFDGRLYLLPVLSELECLEGFDTDWLPEKESLNLAGIWSIHRLNHVDRSLKVSLRREGQRAKPLGRTHSQTIKKLLLEHKVEPWLRHYLPIIYSEGEIVAIGDRVLCSDFQFRMQWLIEHDD